MSEALVPPGTPRNRHRRSGAPGANEQMLAAPDEPMPAGKAASRAKPAANGAAGDSAEARWHDVEWVGFGDEPADEPAPPLAIAEPFIELAAPPRPAAPVTPPEPPPAPARPVAVATPPSSSPTVAAPTTAAEPATPAPVLRFGQPGSGLPMRTPLAIGGLPPRFIRVAVPRSPHPRPGPAAFAAATATVVETAALEPEPTEERHEVSPTPSERFEPPDAPEIELTAIPEPPRARRYSEEEPFFPASFYTPISAEAVPPEASPIERLSGWFTGLGGRLRRKATPRRSEPHAEPQVLEPPLDAARHSSSLEPESAAPVAEAEPVASQPPEPPAAHAAPPEQPPAHEAASTKPEPHRFGFAEVHEPIAPFDEFAAPASSEPAPSSFIERLQPLRRQADRLAGGQPRLSLLVIIAGAVVIALIAYQAGGLLAGFAGARPAIKPPPAPPKHVVAPAGVTPSPASAPADAPPTTQVPAAAPAALTPATPPSEPAARAAFYLTRAKTGDAAAQFDIGVLYARGDGVTQDYGEAAIWFRAAAAQGNVAAAYNLGVLYERGLGVPASTIQALNWYRSAADRNHPAAQYNLALALAEGRGTEQDSAGAARWYRRAAEQGVVPAMVNLAILYEKGEGVDRSMPDAYGWYDAAGERGDTAAKQRAAELYKQFSADDKKRADGIAASVAALIHAPVSPPPPA